MLEKILSEPEINFNQLEKEIFKIGCEYAQELMVNISKVMDKELAQNRNKKEFRHKDTRKITLKTLMGEVEFKRTVYETKNENGENACVYLLDKVLNLETFGKVSTNLAFKIADNACISSFRNLAKNITDMTGQSISHGGVWNVVQSLGKKIKEVEDEYAKIVDNGQVIGQTVSSSDAHLARSKPRSSSSTRDTRNRFMSEIKAKGLAIRQIERLTGIIRGLVQKA